MTNEQQNKPMLIIIAVVLVLLIGGAFFFMKKSSTPTTTDSTTTAEDTNEKSNEDTSMMDSGKNTLMGLMSMGKNLQCNFDYVTEGKAGTKGTIYVSGKKVYGEFESEVDGQKTTMRMIQDGDYSYIWGSAMPEGMKMKIVVPEGKADTSAPANNQYFDPNQQMDFDCSPWGGDPSKFVIPSDVTFRDMSAMMQQPTGEAAKQGQCAACAQLQGEAKTMCEKQLGC